MRVLTILDLDDTDLTDAFRGFGDGSRHEAARRDLGPSLAARCEEVHFGADSAPVRAQVLAVADVTDSLELILSSAEVGLEGPLEDPDARARHEWTADQACGAWEAVQALLRGASREPPAQRSAPFRHSGRARSLCGAGRPQGLSVSAS